MAITVKDSHIQTLYGLSTDAKPTAPTHGTTFYEIDTGKTYRFHGTWDEITTLATLSAGVPVKGAVTKAVDNKSASYTSDAIDMEDYKGCFVLVHDEGSFAGTITMQGALGTGGTATTAYKQYGAAFTLGRCERVDEVPPLIKIDVVRTAGAVSVWVQPYR